MCGWQVQLCDPLVTRGPYLSALEIRSLMLYINLPSLLLLFLLVKLNGQMNSTSKAALLKVVTTDNGIWIPSKLPPCT